MVDDLINVNGIGEVTLEKIKEQGLACVKGEDSVEESENIGEVIEETGSSNSLDVLDEEGKKKETSNSETITTQNMLNNEDTVQKETENVIESKAIVLNGKDIKTVDDKKNLSENIYPVYGFFIFCVLLGFLFLLKKIGERKNEFEV